ncbi:MAG: DinB family protein [Fimbriimonas sp.]
METQETRNVVQLIEKTKDEVQAASAQLLKTFEFVPDDKLNWTPSESARSPLGIVAHCGLANGAFATILRGEKLAFEGGPEEMMALSRRMEAKIDTREAAVKLIQESTASVLDALDGTTSEMLDSTPDSPFGPLPYPFWMSVPPSHMIGHSRQIDYIQTIWGDAVDHR